MDDAKSLTVEKQYMLTDVACYSFPCSHCGKREEVPQVIVKAFGRLAPKRWCCVAQDDRRRYYCEDCSRSLGFGI